MGAAGRIYFTGRDGTTLVLENKPAVEVLAVNRLDDPIDASAAIVARIGGARLEGPQEIDATQQDGDSRAV